LWDLHAVTEKISNWEEQDDVDLPVGLQRSSFASKVLIAWDPRRCLGSMVIELHIGVHVKMDAAYSWYVDGVCNVLGVWEVYKHCYPYFGRFCL